MLIENITTDRRLQQLYQLSRLPAEMVKMQSHFTYQMDYQAVDDLQAVHLLQALYFQAQQEEKHLGNRDFLAFMKREVEAFMQQSGEAARKVVRAWICGM